jgi:hypothetical protein
VLRKLLSEPLLHFLLLGAVLFGVYAVRGPQQDRETVVVSAGQIEHLATTFLRTWQRPPDSEELNVLIDGYVVDQILSREAIKLGLDRDDTVIRRRLRQKMEFVSEDIAATRPPTSAELENYLDEHPDLFRQDTRYTFEHRFVGDAGDGARVAAERLRKQLENGTPIPHAQTDLMMIPREFADASRREVDRHFGDGFAAQLDSVAPDVWGGPLRSGYGLHLVRVTGRTPARSPGLAEVRDEVEREFVNARRLLAQEQMLASLRERYDVIIEPAAVLDDEPSSGGAGR